MDPLGRQSPSRPSTAEPLYSGLMVRRRLNLATKKALLSLAPFFNSEFAYMARLNTGFSRGALNVATRKVDPLRPSTWEFSAFSQHGEDGVIEHLLAHVRQPNRYFVEIGSADGIQ